MKSARSTQIPRTARRLAPVVSAFASRIPLIPPAEVPETMSTVALARALSSSFEYAFSSTR